MRAGRIHTAAGKPIENGLIAIRDGKITYVGPRADFKQLEHAGTVIAAAEVTPGLIDPMTCIGLSGAWNIPADQDQAEPSDPNQADLRVLDGFNPAEGLIEFARANATAKGLRNVEFVVRDLSDFDETAEPAAFDVVTTFDAVHDQAKPLGVLRGIQRTLKSNGTYLMQDISGTSHVDKDIAHPIGTFLYTISCMHCMTVSLAQGGEGLGAMWGEEKTREYLGRAGFRSVETHRLAHDIQNNWYVVMK